MNRVDADDRASFIMAEGAGAGAGANDQDDDPYAALVDPRTYDASRVDAKTKARYLRRRAKFMRWTRAKT